MIRIVALPRAIAWALRAAPATAATVTARDQLQIDAGEGDFNLRTVEYAAAPGEREPARAHSTPATDAVCACVIPRASRRPRRASRRTRHAVCPPRETRLLRVTLADGDDSVRQRPRPVRDRVDRRRRRGQRHASSSRTRPSRAARATTRSTASRDRRPGADVIKAEELDYSDHVEGVFADLAGGLGRAAGENDRLLPGARYVVSGSGPDVVRLRAAPRGRDHRHRRGRR